MTVNAASIKTCLAKMRVLRGQLYFVSDEVLLEALARRILASAKDASHIDRMLSGWILQTKNMLHISEVEGLAKETAGAGGNSGDLSDPCDRCRASEGAFELVDRDGQKVGQRCRCERGRRLSAMDYERKARKSN